MIEPPPASACHDETSFFDYVAELQDALRVQHEAAALREWQGYAELARAPDEELHARESALATLLQESGVLDLAGRWRPLVEHRRSAMLERLERRARRLAVDLDERTRWLARLADELEADAAATPSRTVEARLAETLTELFQHREELARRMGSAGYAELALAADGLEQDEVRSVIDRVDRSSRDPFEEVLAAAAPTGLSSQEVDAGLRARRVELCAGTAVPDVARAWGALRSASHPLLEDVEPSFLQDIGVLGFCEVISWPDDVRMAVRRSPAASAPVDRLDAFALVGHEAGHVLHYRVLREGEIDFEELASTPAAVEESFAEIVERLLFTTEIAQQVGIDPALARCWDVGRLWQLRRQIGRARFDLEAYAAAVDDPGSLHRLWCRHLETATGVDFSDATWVTDGHGFYTEDPMRRHAYPVAWAWADDFFASPNRASTFRAGLDGLREAVRDPGSPLSLR